MAAAAEALRELSLPFMGILTLKSQVSATRRPMPAPSEPMTMAAGPFRSASYSRVPPSTAVPKTHTPASFSSFSRAGRLATRATGTWDTAPAEVLATTAVSPAERRLGMMTPWAPAHSAVRITAPRLWGSDSSSHTTIRGGSPFSRAMDRMSSTVAYSRTAATAMTPWWAWVRLMASSLRRSDSTTTMPLPRAVEAMWPREASVSPLAI